MSGMVDEVIIWNRSLTGEEIEEIYNIKYGEMNKELQAFDCIGDCVRRAATDTASDVQAVASGDTGHSYLDDPTLWSSPAFNDAGWRSGNASFGYAGQLAFHPFSQNSTVAYYEDGAYYFRKRFNVSYFASIKALKLYAAYNDYVQVYLNGVEVLDKSSELGSGAYWDEEVGLDPSLLQLENVLAAKIVNNCTLGNCENADIVFFDIALIGNVLGNVTDTQDKMIVVMSDGEANIDCSAYGYQGSGGMYGPIHAIEASCDAYELYGINVHTVGFNISQSGATTLAEMSKCSKGIYLEADDASQLFDVYETLGYAALVRTRTQEYHGAGELVPSMLYADSYINMTYDPVASEPTQNEISLTLQTPPFGGCVGNITVYETMRMYDAKVLSYSGVHWTQKVQLDDSPVFNLDNYSVVYPIVGDPFIVSLPVNMLTPGTHEVNVTLADGPMNISDCAVNDSIVYSFYLNASTGTGFTVKENAIGCNWTVETDDKQNITLRVPETVVGYNCNYTNGSINYKTDDAYDVAAYQLFRQLDFDSDGRIFLNIEEEDVSIGVSVIDRVPYLWGPTIVETHLWQ